MHQAGIKIGGLVIQYACEKSSLLHGSFGPWELSNGVLVFEAVHNTTQTINFDECDDTDLDILILMRK